VVALGEAAPLRAVELDVHVGGVLVQGGKFAAGPDLHAKFMGMAAEDFLGGRLLDEHTAQAEVAQLPQVQRDQGEVRGGVHWRSP
jgi:hypothetical protein